MNLQFYWNIWCLLPQLSRYFTLSGLLLAQKATYHFQDMVMWRARLSIGFWVNPYPNWFLPKLNRVFTKPKVSRRSVFNQYILKLASEYYLYFNIPVIFAWSYKILLFETTVCPMISITIAFIATLSKRMIKILTFDILFFLETSTLLLLQGWLSFIKCFLC